MKTYLVGIKWEMSRVHIEAKDSTAAKRRYCQIFNRRFNDYWCGASILTAQRVKD